MTLTLPLQCIPHSPLINLLFSVNYCSLIHDGSLLQILLYSFTVTKPRRFNWKTDMSAGIESWRAFSLIPESIQWEQFAYGSQSARIKMNLWMTRPCFFLCASSLAKKMNSRELLFRLSSDPEKEESRECGLGHCTYLFLLENFGMNFSQKMNLIMCLLNYLSITIERTFSYEELPSQPLLFYHVDELSPATNHKTSPRRWAFKMPCCYGEGSNVSFLVIFSL